MDLSPEFSSPIEASSADLVVYETPVFWPPEIQNYLDGMIDSTPISKGTMVTKKETPEVDPWVDKAETNFGGPNLTDRDFLTVTLKAGGGYDAPWLVFHANSVEEAVGALQHDQLDELMDLTARKGKELAKAFGGLPAPSKAPASSGGGWNKPKAPSGSSDAPNDTCPQHNCPLVFVEGYKKRDGSGEVSARYACPVPKCYKKTYWQDKDGSWTLKEQ